MRILVLLLGLMVAPEIVQATPQKYNRKLASAVSMAATVTSSVADLKFLDDASVQFIWYSGATPVGAINLQGSNEVVDSFTSVASWTDLSTSIYTGSVALSGNTGSYLYNIPTAGFRWLRAVYTRTSGSGSLDINFSGKPSSN